PTTTTPADVSMVGQPIGPWDRPRRGYVLRVIRGTHLRTMGRLWYSPHVELNGRSVSGARTGPRKGRNVMQRHPREGWKAARQMIEAQTGRPVTRRDFLRTSAGAGIALPSLAAIMAACTNPRDTSPDNPSNSAGQL